MFMQKLRQNKKGFSLIELVCAMAILAIITLTISGAMVFASNSYKQGSIDTALQQELQFTANAIESLIVDATSEVTFTGNVLKIVNTDYTYEIMYDPTNKTLHYTQYSSLDGSPVATNELLADNVAHFFVDPSNFATARNVVLEITLENGKSNLDYRYNITSRNDVSAGDKPNIVVEFMCENTVVVEPMQQYFLEVDMVGAPSGESYIPSLSGNTTTVTKATTTVGGVLIDVAPVETGDATGRMTLTLESTVKDSTGAPFTKNVEILVRRVTDVSLTPAEYSGGGAYDAGTTYTCTASPVGTNLEKRGDLQSDTTEPYKYISPDNFVWTFEVSSGLPEDWITVGPNGEESSEIQITLKKKVELGDWIKATATARHTTGESKSDGSWSNKASYMAVEQKGYTNKSDCFEIKPVSQVGNSDFRRGDDFQIPIKMDVPELIKKNWEDNPENDGKEWDDNKDGYNSGYTGNHHIRYVSKDNPSNFSVVKEEEQGPANGYSYKGWKKMDYQGNSIDGPNDADDQVFFSAADLDNMKYMEYYTLEMVYSFTYMDKNNVKHTYPWCFDENINPGVTAGLVDVPSEYIYEFTIEPIEVHFGRAKSGDDPTIDLEDKGYLTPSGHGIGSASNPLVVNKSGTLSITYTTIGPGANSKAGVYNLLQGPKILWKSVNGGPWIKERVNVNNVFNNDAKKQTGTLEIDTNNLEKDNIENGVSIVYKLELGTIHDNNTPLDETDDTGGWIYTKETDYEQYSLNNDKGDAARGLIYFKLQ